MEGGNDLAIYEKAPVTHRSAERLAKRHGFRNLSELAQSLPPDAQVLDVGAGKSTLGKEVAKLRPDIHWVNFDTSYKDPQILEKVSKDSPPNIQYVQGDATKLSETYSAGKFDAVFSYWLFSHLSIDDKNPAVEAAKGIFRVTKKGGIMSVGPKLAKIGVPQLMASTLKTSKDDTQSEESYAQMVLRETELGPVRKKVLNMVNRSTYKLKALSSASRNLGRPEREV